MRAMRGNPATMEQVEKTPRTERGRRTLRLLLDAAAAEFGEKGFHESSIVGITARAGVALGSFYTYFESKDAIFRALVRDMSAQVGLKAGEAVESAQGALERERVALLAFLDLAREHKEIYRIIDEAEFVDPATWRQHYEAAAGRIAARLDAGVAAGELRDGLGEVEAWAIMGMNVFLGLRYGVWAEDRPTAETAQLANELLRRGIAR